MNKIGFDAIQRPIVNNIDKLLLLLLIVLGIDILLFEVPPLKPRFGLHTRRLASAARNFITIVIVLRRFIVAIGIYNLPPIESRRLEYTHLKRVDSRPNLLIDIVRVVRADADIIATSAIIVATRRRLLLLMM